MGNDCDRVPGALRRRVARDRTCRSHNVLAIYARENGQGMAFEVSDARPPTQTPRQRIQPQPGARRLVGRSGAEDARREMPTCDPDDDDEPPKKAADRR